MNLTFFYLAIPRLKNFEAGRYDERSGHLGFWTASLGILGMSLAFAVAGVLQAYLERMQGQPELGNFIRQLLSEVAESFYRVQGFQC